MAAYNAAGWIERAVKSVRDQTYENWELLIADDGSEDMTLSICKRLSSTDSRIKISTLSHRGLSSTRNYLLNWASSKIITFLDTDDVLHPEALRLLIEKSEYNNIVIAENRTVRKAPSLFKSVLTSGNSKLRVMEGKEALCEALYRRNPDASVCGKIFNLNLFKDIRFKEGIIFEDLEIMPRLYLKAEKVAYIPLPLYYYVRNKYGIIKSKKNKSTYAVMLATNIHHFLARFLPGIESAARSRRVSAAFHALCNGYLNKRERNLCLSTILKYSPQELSDSKARFRNRISSLPFAICHLIHRSIQKKQH